MSDQGQVPLFPTEVVHEPPTRCPDCGGIVWRHTFTRAECERCPYEWRRSGQIAADEPWPGEPL